MASSNTVLVFPSAAPAPERRITFVDLVKSGSVVPSGSSSADHSKGKKLLTHSDIAALFGSAIKPHSTWNITEYDSRLCIFVSHDPELFIYNGTVIDHKEKRIVLKPVPAPLVGGSILPDVFHSDTKFVYPTDGTTVHLIKYHGHVYYITSRRLNENYVPGVGIPNYRYLYKIHAGPDDERLFGDASTYPYCYSFCLQTAETSFCMKYFAQSLYPIGYRLLELRQGEVAPEKPIFDKIPNREIPKEVAIAIFKGDSSVDPNFFYPDILVTEQNGVTTKYESEDYKWRKLVRGTNAQSPSRFLNLILSCRITTEGVFFDGEEFEALPSKLILHNHSAYIVPGRVLCKYPQMTQASAVAPEGTYDSSRFVPIRSKSTIVYDADAHDQLQNIINCVYLHLMAAVSPLKYEEISSIRESILSAIGNMVAYYNDETQPTSGASRVKYEPKKFANGYTPTPPKYTIEAMFAYVKTKHNMSIPYAISAWLLEADNTDFYHIMKYFASLDVAPPQRISTPMEKKPYKPDTRKPFKKNDSKPFKPHPSKAKKPEPSAKPAPSASKTDVKLKSMSVNFGTKLSPSAKASTAARSIGH